MTTDMKTKRRKGHAGIGYMDDALKKRLPGQGTESITPAHTICDQETLLRLAENLYDSDALVSLFARHKQSIEEAIFRQLSKNTLFDGGMCNALVHIAQSPHSFDPKVLSPKEGILKGALREVRRLKCVIECHSCKNGALEPKSNTDV